VVVGAESGGDETWSGQYVAPSVPLRSLRLVWRPATEAAAVALRVTLQSLARGFAPVVYTPPTDPNSSRPAEQSTIIGRLRAPFSFRQLGFNNYELSVVLEEDQ